MLPCYRWVIVFAEQRVCVDPTLNQLRQSLRHLTGKFYQLYRPTFTYNQATFVLENLVTLHRVARKFTAMSKPRYFVSTKQQRQEKLTSGKDNAHKYHKVDLQNSSTRSLKRSKDPFAGDAPISNERKRPHKRGSTNNTRGSTAKVKRQLTRQENAYEDATIQAARHDIFLLEDAGFIDTDVDHKSYTIRQSEIRQNVDIASSCKQFELNLNQFGPYRINYTSNGKYLLLGGRKGHVAAFEWFSKKLLCEVNVLESINDIKWLHSENMFAVAQNQWTYVYDNNGIELHCLKSLHRTLRLEFLPYHFLLVASTATGFLHYLDTSIGKAVVNHRTKLGRLNVMTQNQYNAVVLLGHHNGTVTMWSPNMKEPLVKMLCHRNAIRSIAVDKSGLYMATSGQDGHIRIFDIRKYTPLHSYKVMRSPSNLKFSQRGLLAATFGNIVEIYKDPCREIQEEPYLIQKLRHPAEAVEFCPFEDVLGVGREDGFESLLVPGSGEPNYDSFESNPYRSKSQRREWEVKALLEKIQPDMISLDPFHIGTMDKKTAKHLQQQKEESVIDPHKSQLKYKAKGKSSAGNVAKRKQLIRNAEMRNRIKEDLMKKNERLDDTSGSETQISGPACALDRFRKKKK